MQVHDTERIRCPFPKGAALNFYHSGSIITRKLELLAVSVDGSPPYTNEYQWSDYINNIIIKILPFLLLYWDARLIDKAGSLIVRVVVVGNMVTSFNPCPSICLASFGTRIRMYFGMYLHRIGPVEL